MKSSKILYLFVSILILTLHSCVRADRNSLSINSSAGLGFLFWSYLENAYRVSGTVKGVTGSSITLQNHGWGDLVIYGDDAGSTQSFQFNSAFDYDITVSDSGGRSCSVINGSGTLTGEVNDVEISCILNFSSGQSAVGTITGFSSVYMNSAVVAGKLIVPDDTANTLRFFDASITSGTINGDQIFSITGAAKTAAVFALNNGSDGFGYADYNVGTYGNIYLWDSMITASGDYTGARTLLSAPGVTCDGTHIQYPEGAYSDGTHLMIADNYNNRVLIWNSIPTTQDTPPDLLLGQTSLTSCSSPSAAASSLSSPYAVWSDGERIVVVDEYYHRIMIWNSWPAASGQPADIVLGQPDFTTGSPGAPAVDDVNSPFGMYVNGDQIFVADNYNNRILIWNTWPTTINQPADVVLGQNDFTSNTPGSGSNQMSSPYGLVVYENRLYVNDYGNNRVLVFASK